MPRFWKEFGGGTAQVSRVAERSFVNFTTVLGFVAGVLQFVVAGYALRLNRQFGTMRVGWSLFWAFLLLACLHLMESVMESSPGAQYVIKVDVMNVFISLLLLIGMVHLQGMLKERVRVQREEQRLRRELELEVKKKTVFLTRALEELQAEIDERKRVETEANTTRGELSAVSRKAETALLAANVLERVGEMLKSVNASATLVSDQMKQSRIENVVRVGALIREHAADLGAFLTGDARGQKLPTYIAQLAEHLATEQNGVLNELESIRTNLEKIQTMQQGYLKIAGEVPPEKSAEPAQEAQTVQPMDATAAAAA
jgi:hypothetical protein